MQATRESNATLGVWKRKVEQIGEEADHLRLVLDRHSHHERRRASGLAEGQCSSLGSDVWQDSSHAVPCGTKSALLSRYCALHPDTGFLELMSWVCE